MPNFIYFSYTIYIQMNNIENQRYLDIVNFMASFGQRQQIQDHFFEENLKLILVILSLS